MPLDIAAALLQLDPQPLHIAILADRLTNGRSAADLHTLALRHLTPPHAYEVTHAATTMQAAALFVQHFSTDRFPLMTEHLPLDIGFLDPGEYDEDTQFAVNYLLNGVPYRLHGFDHYEELHEMHRHTYPALIVVCAFLNFFGVTDNHPEYIRQESTAMRYVWTEHLQDEAGVPPEALEGIPPFGYPTEHFVHAVTGTPHAGAVHLATVLAESSDNVFLSWYNSEEVLEFSDPWTDEVIEEGVTLWAEARTVLEGMTAYMQEQDSRIPQMAAELRHLLDSRTPTAQGNEE